MRHELGIGAFGTNAYVAQAAGDDVVEPHTEEASGHEELYFVARGSATFTLDGDEVQAPAGTYVFLPDPAVHRRAVADEAGTTVMSFGAPRGRGVHRLGLGGALPRHRDPRARPGAGAGALRGRARGATRGASGRTTTSRAGTRSTAAPTTARALLERAIELGGDEVRAQAREDPDLASLRDGEAPA